MKYLSNYLKFDESIDNQFFKTKDEIVEWLNKIHIRNYTINDDLTVDTHDDEVNITHMKLLYTCTI